MPVLIIFGLTYFILIIVGIASVLKNKSNLKYTNIRVGDAVMYNGEVYKVESIDTVGMCRIRKLNKMKTKKVKISKLTKYVSMTQSMNIRTAAPKPVVKNPPVVKQNEKIIPFHNCPLCGGAFIRSKIDFNSNVFECEYCNSIFNFNGEVLNNK